MKSIIRETMSNIITYVIAAYVAVYALVLVGDVTCTRRVKAVLLEGLALLVVVVVLYVATGFPMPPGRGLFNTEKGGATVARKKKTNQLSPPRSTEPTSLTFTVPRSL